MVLSGTTQGLASHWRVFQAKIKERPTNVVAIVFSLRSVHTTPAYPCNPRVHTQSPMVPPELQVTLPIPSGLAEGDTIIHSYAGRGAH